jgi:hypothetical protein
MQTIMAMLVVRTLLLPVALSHAQDADTLPAWRLMCGLPLVSLWSHTACVW